jgi:hypothetical protein
VQEWGAHHDRIVFRTGVTLLQAASAAGLERVLNDGVLAPHVARSLLPAIALVEKGHEETLLGALLAQGEMPALVDDHIERTDKSVVIQADGVIVPIHRMPSLYLETRLARIAERDAEGRWRITQASVARAGGDRVRVRALLAEAGVLQRGVMPATLVADIKRWGGYWGRVGIEALTLLEFESREHLSELMAQAEAAAYLTPFAAGERALAVVDTASLPAVERMLAELGVQVRRGLQGG